MTQNFRFDFSPSVVAQRTHVLQQIQGFLVQDTVEAVRHAAELQKDWLAQYPDDAVMWDIGESLAMMEDAFAAEAQPEPVAAK